MLRRIDADLSVIYALDRRASEGSLSHKYIRDKELLSSREQYYLYMIEFELVNRIHRERFANSSFRIALLPHCLKETQDRL